MKTIVKKQLPLAAWDREQQNKEIIKKRYPCVKYNDWF
jgi:hypothetical protein